MLLPAEQDALSTRLITKLSGTQNMSQDTSILNTFTENDFTCSEPMFLYVFIEHNARSAI
jgi:hypothetical protein